MSILGDACMEEWLCLRRHYPGRQLNTNVKIIGSLDFAKKFGGYCIKPE